MALGHADRNWTIPGSEMVDDAGTAMSTPHPVCSICIANYNGEDLLADCIGSIRGQTTDAAIEIIVHDDASTDGSLALLENLGDIRVIASSENVGFCIANNRMVATARGDYVLLLNNDAALQPDAIATLLDAACSTPGGGILTLPQYDWLEGTLVDRGCLLDPFYNPVPNLDPRRRDVAMAIGACLWMPRLLWNEIGGFPEWMGSLAEDMYLCCAARQRGLPVSVTASSGYRHRQGHSIGGNRVQDDRLRTTYRRRALSELNKTCVMILFTPTVLLACLLPVHLLLLTLEGLLLALLRRDPKVFTDIYLSTLKRLAASAATLRSRRRQLQAARRIGTRAYLSAFTFRPRKLVLLARHGVPSIR
ncbi:MAG: glycosyltransferase [Pseudomonadota bacterium]